MDSIAIDNLTSPAVPVIVPQCTPPVVAPIAFFQPICSVRTRSVFGVEALARGIDEKGRVIPASRVFADAENAGQSRQCEMACRRKAITDFSSVIGGPEPMMLFLNLNLLASDGEDDVEQLLEVSRRWSVPPRNIVVEVLESRFDDTQRLAAILARFHEQGFLVALDDVGAGHSNLDRVPLIRPDIMKVDRELVQHLDSDYYKQGVFKALVGLARRIGALIVAEGVETESESLMALELGADLLQGYHVSRPLPPEQLLPHRVESIVRKLAERFKQYMIAKTSERRLTHRRYNVLIETLLCNLACSPSADFNAVLRNAVEKSDSIECVYVLDEIGIQVTETIFRPVETFVRSQSIFRPAPLGTDHSLKEYYYMLLDAELPKFTTDPYVSLASGNLCRTISTCFRDGFQNRLYVLCVDVKIS